MLVDPLQRAGELLGPRPAFLGRALVARPGRPRVVTSLAGRVGPRRRPPPRPEPTRTTPTRADYAGRGRRVGGGSVAVSVHGDKAVAYVCNGSTVEGWMRGKVQNGKLVLTGKNKAHLTASYHAGKVTGGRRGPRHRLQLLHVHGEQGRRAYTRPTAKGTGARRSRPAGSCWATARRIGSLETDADFGPAERGDGTVSSTWPR